MIVFHIINRVYFILSSLNISSSMWTMVRIKYRLMTLLAYIFSSGTICNFQITSKQKKYNVVFLWVETLHLNNALNIAFPYGLFVFHFPIFLQNETSEISMIEINVTLSTISLHIWIFFPTYLLTFGNRAMFRIDMN